MAGFVVKNNAESLVADNPLASGATTLNVTSGEGDNFPSTFPYRLTIWDDEAHADPTDDPEMEIVECTDRTGDALEIVRGKEGTSDVEHANGERVAMLITAGLFNDSTHGIITKLDGIESGATISLIAKSITDIASVIDGASTDSIPASYFNNVFGVSDAASIFNDANLTAAKGASIFNDANLTAAKLISILDNDNISSAKIKSIFETGSLSVDEKRAAVLEGDQYAVADAADSVNGSFYTDDQLALAFNDANLTAAKGASIFNDANLTAAKGASICAEAGLTQSRFNSIFDNTNLTDARISSILNDSNFAGKAQKGQECFDAMTRSKTGFTNGIYISEILDDWEDNKLTSRDNAETTGTGFTDRFGKTFRPEWTIAAGTPSVADGVLSLDANDDVKIPSTFDVGTWQIHENLPDDAGFYFHIMRYDVDNTIKFYIDRYNTDELDLYKVDGGSTTTLISYTSWGGAAGDVKVTRDESGNWEMFDETGTSRGTATDTFIPTDWDCIYLAGVDGTSAIDNLEVY